MRFILFSILLSMLRAADWTPLVLNHNLDTWEIIGDGQWTLMSDGALLGQRTGDLP